jgi:hypothetical protein
MCFFVNYLIIVMLYHVPSVIVEMFFYETGELPLLILLKKTETIQLFNHTRMNQKNGKKLNRAKKN